MQAADARLKTFRQGVELSLCRKETSLRFRFCRQQLSTCLRSENKKTSRNSLIFSSVLFSPVRTDRGRSPSSEHAGIAPDASRVGITQSERRHAFSGLLTAHELPLAKPRQHSRHTAQKKNWSGCVPRTALSVLDRTRAEGKAGAACRKQPLLRQRSPRPFPFLSRLFESRPRAFFSLHLTTPFGTPAPTALFPALCASLILVSPGTSRLPAISPVLLPLPVSAFRHAGQVGLHFSKPPAHDVPR